MCKVIVYVESINYLFCNVDLFNKIWMIDLVRIIKKEVDFNWYIDDVIWINKENKNYDMFFFCLDLFIVMVRYL